MKRTLKHGFLLLPVFGGIAALLWILLDRSDQKNAVLFGLSRIRLFMAGAVLGLILLCILFYARRLYRQPYLWYLGGAAAVVSAELLIFSRFPNDDTRNLIPLIAGRGLPLLLALLFCALCWRIALACSENNPRPRFFDFFPLCTAIPVYWGISSHIDRFAWEIDLRGNTLMCTACLIFALIWYLTLRSDGGRGWKTAAGCLFFIVFGYCLTRSAGMWLGRTDTPPNAYWNELAVSFLDGRLDLPHPSGTHDLTLYDGRWYVPNPPLPAILLLPWTLLAGSVNTCVYSAVLTGICAGLFFLMLILSFIRYSGPLSMSCPDDSAYPAGSLSICVWVTVLFTFGTDLLWLGTTGQMWFISQLVVVALTLLGCISAICGASPWICGVCLGLGMLSRPNIFPVFFCLLGIRLHQDHDFPRIGWKKTFGWCLKCGIPMVISAGLLLVYNKLRFDDWMDFGYITINGADWILENVRTYGMFHPHFLKENANVMLLGLPRLDLSGERYFFQPHVAGYSVFLMAPPLVYVFRSCRRNWFAAGAWTSVLVTVALLLFYHNTGAEQIGYRYILDAAAPLALMTASGTKGKVSRLFKILTIFAVGLSLIAITWWYRGRV